MTPGCWNRPGGGSCAPHGQWFLPRDRFGRVGRRRSWTPHTIDDAHRSEGVRMDVRPEDLVRGAEEAYNALDVERVMRLFTPDAVFYRNGKLKAKGADELRRFHEGFCGEFWTIEEDRLAEWHLYWRSYPRS